MRQQSSAGVGGDVSTLQRTSWHPTAGERGEGGLWLAKRSCSDVRAEAITQRICLLLPKYMILINGVDSE